MDVKKSMEENASPRGGHELEPMYVPEPSNTDHTPWELEPKQRLPRELHMRRRTLRESESTISFAENHEGIMGFRQSVND